MRLVLIAIAVGLLILAGGFLYLLNVAGNMDPGNEEVRIEVSDDFED